MPVTARLSRKFYETLGDDIANELVDWFNQVDLSYRSGLEQVNELNYQRFDARLEQGLAEVQARVDTRFAELAAQMDVRFAEADARVERRFAEADARVDKRFAEADARVEKRFADFGARHATSNYAFLYTAKGIAAIIGGGLAAVLYEVSGSWSSGLYGSAVLALGSAALALYLRQRPLRGLSL